MLLNDDGIVIIIVLILIIYIGKPVKPAKLLVTLSMANEYWWQLGVTARAYKMPPPVTVVLIGTLYLYRRSLYISCSSSFYY